MAALAFVALFGVKVESWIISDCVIRYKNGLWKKERLFESSPGTAFIVRPEVIPCDSEGTPPTFPYVVHLIGPGEIEIGCGFRFRERTTMIGFLESLRESSAIAVTDPKSRMEELDTNSTGFRS